MVLNMNSKALANIFPIFTGSTILLSSCQCLGSVNWINASMSRNSASEIKFAI